MKLAMRLPERSASGDTDPREEATADVIDLASRTSYPAVANRRSKADALGLLAGVAFVALLGAVTLWGLNASRTKQGQSTSAATVPAPKPATVEPQPARPQPAAPVAAPAPAPAKVTAPTAATNPYSSPTVVFDAGAVPSAKAPAKAPKVPAPKGSVIPGAGTAGQFAAAVGGVGGGIVSAREDFNPATTIAQGTMIPAVLETAIDTDVPGYVRAVVSQDVRSFDGSHVLVPRSSRLIGQYQSGLQAGQRRAYVIWTRLIRPDGVSVALASPATGFDGTTGLAGKVDTHFFQRFGSAMLLSVITGLTTVTTGGAAIVVGGGQSAASTALQQDGKRPPTIHVRQGQPIRIFTARDLDFSKAPVVTN